MKRQKINAKCRVYDIANRRANGATKRHADFGCAVEEERLREVFKGLACVSMAYDRMEPSSICLSVGDDEI